MKILILSDIHANFPALLKLEKEMSEADKILFLGDYIGYGRNVNETINYIRSLPNAVCVKGNHDAYLINGFTKEVNKRVKSGIDYAKHIITKENFDWLQCLPTQQELVLDGKRFLIQHASPNDYLEEYIYPDSKKFEYFYSLCYDFIAMGHTHHPFCMSNNSCYIVNPGSVGQSRNIENKVCYAIYDSISEIVKLKHKDLI